MANFLKKLSLVFSAGVLGGLANGIAVWAAGVSGITIALGVKIAPALTPSWLYPRLVWGGIWGVVFLLPIIKKRWLVRGIFLSLGPTFVQLFVIFPLKAQQDMLGLKMGLLTPLFVLFFNAVWGVVAAAWLRIIRS